MTQVVETTNQALERAEHAHRVERQIINGCRTIRRAWAVLAGHLHEMYAQELWRPLGYDSWNAWLASPDISLQRSQVYALVEAHHELVVKREISVDEFAEIPSTKVIEVLPAIRAGEVEVDEALADARELSRSDLRERYRGNDTPGSPLDAERNEAFCAACGRKL